MDWRNKIPTNRQIEARWAEFCEILGESFDDFITPELQRLKSIFTSKASQDDMRQRIGGLRTNFIQKGYTHTAEQLAGEMSIQMVDMKGTTKLWEVYARQLGFGLDDLHVESLEVDSVEDYAIRNFRAGSRYQTSRVSLVLSTRNERWLHQPVSDAGDLLFQFAKKTVPAHIYIDKVILEAPIDTVQKDVLWATCIENERICRISL